jgi:hypothetical protein
MYIDVCARWCKGGSGVGGGQRVSRVANDCPSLLVSERVSCIMVAIDRDWLCLITVSRTANNVRKDIYYG